MNDTPDPARHPSENPSGDSSGDQPPGDWGVSPAMDSPAAPPLGFRAALEHFGVSLDMGLDHPLKEYCRVLWEWNAKLNLTRHDTFEKFVARDLVDTMQLAEHIPRGQNVLDVGSGGGVPGMVLSIIRPDLNVTVCDSVTKKANALAGIASELNLPLRVAHARAESLLEVASYDVLTARAVGPLTRMLTWFEDRWDSIGQLLLIKGPKWVDERGEARHHGKMKGLELRKLAQYPIPGCAWNGVILSIQPKNRGG